jgi:hypothetical protein
VPMFIPEYEQSYGTLADAGARERFNENFAHNERHFSSLLDTIEPVFTLARLPGAGQAIEHAGKRTYVDATYQAGLVHVGWNLELAPNGRFAQAFATNWQGLEGLAGTSPALPAAHDILLLHDNHFRGRGDLLLGLIELLKQKGYSFGRLDGSGACVAP